jgi:uncharacterized protein (TIGR02594 family)
MADQKQSSGNKGRWAAIAAAIGATAVFLGNVDKIWTTLSGWVDGEKKAATPAPVTPQIIIQITPELLKKLAADTTTRVQDAPERVRLEAEREARSLNAAAENLHKPIALPRTTEPLPSWLTIAFKEVGQTEIPGADHNPRILEYISSTHPQLKEQGDELPWSVFFVNWALAQGGAAGTKSGAARSFLQWGVPLDQPKPGAVAVFERPGNAMGGHACFYIGDAADQVLCLSGNVANSVQISAQPKSRLLGYRWPST